MPYFNYIFININWINYNVEILFIDFNKLHNLHKNKSKYHKFLRVREANNW